MLIDGLKQRNLDRETLFVIHGDHGEAFGQHEGNFAHSLHVFEENVKVPLVIAAPGAIPSKRVGGAASLIDIAPTILDAVGGTTPKNYQGQSLWAGVPAVALFYADYSTGWLGLRDGDWKFTLEVESKRPKLYRLNDDPQENRDLSTQFPERTEAYREHVLSWSAAQRHRVLEATKN